MDDSAGAVAKKIPVHVEVTVHPSQQLPETLRAHVLTFLHDTCALFRTGSLSIPPEAPLASYVESAAVTQLGSAKHTPDSVSFWQADLQVHIFTLSDVAPEADVLESPEGDSDDMSPCTQWPLPHRDFRGLWESLILEAGVKERLVEFAASALRFAASGVQNHVISCNRMVLLHGPPGTGKTTMCKALAQKLAIRLSHLYDNAVLVEIHSHSLFSKWFSESGKLVARLFEHIQELVEEPGTLVFVLIDEVESLTSARASAMGGSEPSDAVRVVNAMLTQLDRLKRNPNVLTLCTTNLSSAIDAAFIDRADIKALIGLPPAQARYAILRDCVLELTRVGILSPHEAITAVSASPSGGNDAEAELLLAAHMAEGLSGRTLRKLPFLAHATYVGSGGTCTPSEFIFALKRTIDDEHRSRADMAEGGQVPAPPNERSASGMA